MRNALISWLCDKATIDKNIFLLTADLGYSVIEPFQSIHGDNFINVGVAEQNMTGIAAGLASEGNRVYTYSIGVFPTFRCAEQIRNDIDYHKFPVVTCTVGSGTAYGNLGYSHHAIQDLSLMRSLPNMIIASPSDPAEVIKILDWHYQNPCPMYLRLHKAGEPELCNPLEVINPGMIRQINPLCNATDNSTNLETCLITTGFLAEKVVKLAISHSVNIPVITVPLWGGPASKDFAQHINKYKKLITIEDHVLSGGFGSYVMECVSRYDICAKVIPIAFDDDVIGQVAREDTLLKPLLAKLESAILTNVGYSC